MSQSFLRGLRAWTNTGKKAGFFLLLAAGSCAAGFLIAWPLWLFATRAREAYTITALCLAAAAVVFLFARAALRRRHDLQDPGRPARGAAETLLGFLRALVAVAGLYAVAVLFARRLWILGALAFVPGILLIWAFTRVRGAVLARKLRRKTADTLDT